MRQGVQDLANFYATPLGLAVGRLISRKIREVWGGASGLDVLGIGYAAPFLHGLDLSARRVVVAMPAGMGARTWPGHAANRACLVADGALPFGNALFDRVLATHALEESENLAGLLTELHRILSPSGRAILAVPARHGLWADAEVSPFGHGRPFSRRQLEALVREADLEPMGWTRALYLPPFAWAAPWSDAFEQLGCRIFPPFAGVILMEAAKQTFAVRPSGYPARRQIRRSPSFQPAPIGGKIVGHESAHRTQI